MWILKKVKSPDTFWESWEDGRQAEIITQVKGQFLNWDSKHFSGSIIEKY